MNKYLLNHKRKLFTCVRPKNTFTIDYSNGYPVQVTTNVTKNTKWSDIFKGDYDFVNTDGTPQYILVNGKKYTYIDYKYATQVLRYEFVESNGCVIDHYKSEFMQKIEEFARRIL